jgi:hypothetical protein
MGGSLSFEAYLCYLVSLLLHFVVFDLVFVWLSLFSSLFVIVEQLLRHLHTGSSPLAICSSVFDVGLLIFTLLFHFVICFVWFICFVFGYSFAGWPISCQFVRCYVAPRRVCMFVLVLSFGLVLVFSISF